MNSSQNDLRARISVLETELGLLKAKPPRVVLGWSGPTANTTTKGTTV